MFPFIHEKPWRCGRTGRRHAPSRLRQRRPAHCRTPRLSINDVQPMPIRSISLGADERANVLWRATISALSSTL
jgi:hypothetical protein